MDESGAVLGGDEVRGQDRVTLLAVRRAGDEVERRLVARADQLAAREPFEHLGARAEDSLDERLGEDHRVILASVPARSSAPGRPQPPRWRPASRGSWSRSAAHRPPGRARAARRPAGARTPTGRARPGRPPAARARGLTASPGHAGSTGRPSVFRTAAPCRRSSPAPTRPTRCSPDRASCTRARGRSRSRSARSAGSSPRRG